MGLYLVRWIEGHTDIVAADDELDLADRLDEIGDPHAAAWKEYDGPLHMRLTITTDGTFEANEVGSGVREGVRELAFPNVEAVFQREDEAIETDVESPEYLVGRRDFYEALAADMHTWPPEGWATCESEGIGIGSSGRLEQHERVIALDDEMMAIVEAQRQAFVAKFGREPTASNPIFFDPDADVPMWIAPDVALAAFHDLLAAAIESGVDPAFVHAMRTTQRVVTVETWDLLTTDEQAEWTFAVEDYRRAHPAADS